MDQVIYSVVFCSFAGTRISDDDRWPENRYRQTPFKLFDLNLGQIFSLFVKIAESRIVFEFGFEYLACSFSRNIAS